RMRLFDLGGEGQCVCVRIEDATLLAPAQQRLVLVLAVQVNELATDLTHQCSRARGAIDPGPVAPLGRYLTADDEQSLFRLDALLREGPDDGRMRADVEDTLNARPPGARAHDVGGRALTEQQGERADDDRLACAGLARERVQPGFEAERQALDDGEVENAQLDQHTRRFME